MRRCERSVKVGRCVQQNFAGWTRGLLLHLRLHLALLRSAEFIGADVANILTHVFQIVVDLVGLFLVRLRVFRFGKGWIGEVGLAIDWGGV